MDTNSPPPPDTNEASPAVNPMIEMKMLICGPGVMLTANVGITGVNIKDLMAIEGDRLHKDLVTAANTAVEILARQYNGQPTPQVTNMAEQSKAA